MPSLRSAVYIIAVSFDQREIGAVAPPLLVSTQLLSFIFEQDAVRQKVKESLMTIPEYSVQEGSALNARDGLDDDKRWQFALVVPHLRRTLR